MITMDIIVHLSVKCTHYPTPISGLMTVVSSNVLGTHSCRTAGCERRPNTIETTKPVVYKPFRFLRNKCVDVYLINVLTNVARG